MACCCPPADADSDPMGRICRVSEGLYISGCMALRRHQDLKAKGITHILNMIGDKIYQERFMGGREFCYFPNDFKYKILATNDDVDQDLSRYFPETNAFIEEGMRSGGILVHCFAGVSRSSTAICAFLIEKKGKSLDEALAMVRSGRPEAKPNVNFMEQLKKHEQRCRGAQGAATATNTQYGANWNQQQQPNMPPQFTSSMQAGFGAPGQMMIGQAPGFPGARV